MKLLLLLATLAPLTAQQPAPETKPAETKPASPATDAASPVPSTEPWLTGSVDFGYRWLTGIGGSVATYRTFVDLGSGPKLLATEFTLKDPKKRLFDEAHVRAYGWGGEPYSIFHLDARKSKWYDFTADYRDLVYFNNLPSFADPLLSRGITLDEQSFDTRRRLANFELDLLPGNWIIPYLGYSRDAGSGTGVAVFVSDANQFPVPNSLHDQTNLYRGGVRIERKRFHATLEQGGTTYKEDQALFWSSPPLNFGNVTTPVLGQTLFLANLLAAYGIRGTSIYSKALFTASAASWLDLYGQLLYSQPDSNIHYQQQDAGNLLLQSELLFYNSQLYLVAAAAKLPHTTGSFGAEIRPASRWRIVQTWLTDRLHNSGSASSTQTLGAPGLVSQMSALLASSLVANYSQEEVDVFFDLTPRLTLRGGYRYVWGDASDVILPPEGLAGLEHGSLRRNAGLGGVTYHPSQKMSISGDFEGASSSGVYFRTSLYNYQRVRARTRYQLTTTLNLSADFSLLNNQNPSPGVHYDFLAHQESLALLWSPAGGKTWDFEGSYSRSTVRSDINFLEPENLMPERSFYRENDHTVTALFHLNLPGMGISGFAPKLSAGGSFFLSSGSRPTTYYQPVGTLFVPFSKKATFFAEWRYYGYGEAFYLFEGFRANLVTAGLKWIL